MARWHRSQIAKCRPNDLGLIRQSPAKIVILLKKMVMRRALQWGRNELRILPSKMIGRNFVLRPLCVVEFLGNDMSLPGSSQSLTMFFFPAKTPK